MTSTINGGAQPSPMTRKFEIQTVTIASGGTTSTAWDMRHFCDCLIQIDTDLSGNTLTFLHCDTEDGTFSTLNDRVANGGTPAPLSITAPTVSSGSEWMPFPDTGNPAMCAGFLKMVTGTATAGALTIKILCKG